MRPGFFIKEALRSIRRNPIPSFAAMASMLVTLLVLGVFIPIVQATTGAANDGPRPRAARRLHASATPRAATSRASARGSTNDTPHVKKVEFVSKAQALKQERKSNPEAYKLLGSNPLPDTFRVTPDNPDNIGAILDALAPRNPQAAARRSSTSRSSEVATRRTRPTRSSPPPLVKWSMALLASLLVLASRAAGLEHDPAVAVLRRREVEVMKLVGATDWFIRWPFVIEGVVLGALGGVLAVLLLAVGKIALDRPAVERTSR